MKQLIKVSDPESGIAWDLPILFEDSHLLAVSKPAGLPTAADAAAPPGPNLMRLLHSGIAEGKSWAKQRDLRFLLNANSLDAEVSGVVLMGRGKEVMATMANAFGSEKPLRVYVALAQGEPAEDEFECSASLAPDRANPGVIRVNPSQGKRSRTTFKVLKRYRGYTLLECRALTDRPHQIRVHLKHLRLPVAGDTSYGGRWLLLSRLKSDYHLKPGKKERPLLSSPAVHGERLELAHPVTGEQLIIHAPWSNDLTVAVKYLERYASPNLGTSPIATDPDLTAPPATPE